MDPLKIIQKYYKKDSKTYNILVEHSRMVANKALEIAQKNPHLNADIQFIEEAAMLHDIGVFLTDVPKAGYFGDMPYACHGYLGREILEKEGFPKHALVCERHLGVGLSAKYIKEHNLPLPIRNMFPVTIEEEIITFADKFYSKNKKNLNKEKEIKEIEEDLKSHGEYMVKKFDEWIDKFNYYE